MVLYSTVNPPRGDLPQCDRKFHAKRGPRSASADATGARRASPSWVSDIRVVHQLPDATVQQVEILVSLDLTPATSARSSQLEPGRAGVIDGVIRPIVDKVFPFEKTGDALAYVETGSAKGKVIITVAD